MICFHNRTTGRVSDTTGQLLTSTACQIAEGAGRRVQCCARGEVQRDVPPHRRDARPQLTLLPPTPPPPVPATPQTRLLTQGEGGGGYIIQQPMAFAVMSRCERQIRDIRNAHNVSVQILLRNKKHEERGTLHRQMESLTINSGHSDSGVTRTV
ncbi:hypothetical protein J6590_060499 [Homalodisca vitripennis]|nr:hypothetical protein J6590_060499 [Homalodisca vitripennis]